MNLNYADAVMIARAIRVEINNKYDSICIQNHHDIFTLSLNADSFIRYAFHLSM